MGNHLNESTMSIISTHTTIHRRIKEFVKWIAPIPEVRDKIKTQSDEIRERISSKAEKDGLIINSTPFSGSFAKYSGLRRHLLGNSVEEGQDIDIAFIMKPKDKSGNPLGCQVHKFRKCAEESYPDSEVDNTKSSATIKFSGTKLKYDLVPLFDTDKGNIQLLKRTDGIERTTSVVEHVEFINKRKRSSDAIDGVVRFNECLRLVKWWRTEKQEHSGLFGNEEGDENVPSFLLDLLCAYAYDHRSVDKTYPGTLAMWFGFLANVVRYRKDVIFGSLIDKNHSNGALWRVIDPIDADNNVVAKWTNAKINELARWLEDSRDEINRAVRYDEAGEDNASMECLMKLFGKAFKSNSES